VSKPLSPALLALTASALAIPGMARAAASVDYHFSDYREDPIAADKTSNPDHQRYQVQSHQLRIAGSPSDVFEVSADLTWETMSGASPWFILPDANGKPVQVMSGATISDRRADLLLKGTRKFGDFAVTAQGGYSTERDYRAINGGVEASFDFNDRLGTVSAGAGYSGDTVEPTDGASARFPTRIDHATRKSITGYVGVSHVIDADTVAQTSFSYTQDSGYLSDPYKQAYVESNLVPDTRPDGRKRIAWMLKLRHAFAGIHGAVHTDYRLYSDDWEVLSHTLEASWHQGLPGDWNLVPGVRWYSQSQAYYYAPYYGTARSDNLYSADYRLSPYGAISLSLAVDKTFSGWTLGLRYENYTSSAGYAAGSVGVENPGLVDFKVLSASVRKAF
jgi:hypothetical protein